MKISKQGDNNRFYSEVNREGVRQRTLRALRSRGRVASPPCDRHTTQRAIVPDLVALKVTRATLIPLIGWWSHIVIDVFTHSAQYYAVPVLYPITMRGFDGIAWNMPWFMALNYAALAFAALWLFVSRPPRVPRH